MRRLHLITPFLLGLALAVPGPAAHAQVAVGLSITIAPPVLPVYVQPAIPAPGYIWTPGLLGVWPGRLLLGAGHLGSAAAGRPFVDPGLLGVEQRCVCLERRLLGPDSRVLRRHRLRLRLYRRRLLRRPLGSRAVAA